LLDILTLRKSFARVKFIRQRCINRFFNNSLKAHENHLFGQPVLQKLKQSGGRRERYLYFCLFVRLKIKWLCNKL